MKNNDILLNSPYHAHAHKEGFILKRGWTVLESKYLDLLAQKYDCEEKVVTEIINLKAILNLPKGTEHFVSDLHGEYQAFQHVAQWFRTSQREDTRHLQRCHLR